MAETTITEPAPLHVDTFPVMCWSANFQTHTLSQPRPGLLVVSPSLMQRIFGLTISLMGCIAIGVMIGMRSFPPPSFAFLFLLIGLFFMGMGLTVAFYSSLFEFDKDLGEFRYRPWLTTHRRPLADVVALQLADGGWHRAKNSRYHTTQLIVVVNEMPKVRICLTNHSSQCATQDMAMELAVFLDVPFLNHLAG